MSLRVLVLFLALAVPTSYPAKSRQTFRERYGQPISETFLVRPGIVASATYGASGDTCEVVISSKQPDVLIKRWPGSEEIDYRLLSEIEDDLAPKSERGEFKISTFMDITCLPENDCQGAEEDWQNVSMYSNAGKSGARYEVISWHRDECRSKTK